MIILGIDPGYAIVGYGVIEKIGNKIVTYFYFLNLPNEKLLKLLHTKIIIYIIKLH